MKYENISSSLNEMINERRNRLIRFLDMKQITEQEAQYNFLTFLQKLFPLDSNKAFTIYTNTTLKGEN